jgi:hypothetical protein
VENTLGNITIRIIFAEALFTSRLSLASLFIFFFEDKQIIKRMRDADLYFLILSDLHTLSIYHSRCHAKHLEQRESI